MPSRHLRLALTLLIVAAGPAIAVQVTGYARAFVTTTVLAHTRIT